MGAKALRSSNAGPTEQYKPFVDWCDDPKRAHGDATIFADRIRDFDESKRIQRTLYAALRHHVTGLAEGLRFRCLRAKRGETYEVHIVIEALSPLFLRGGGDPRPGAVRR